MLQFLECYWCRLHPYKKREKNNTRRKYNKLTAKSLRRHTVLYGKLRDKRNVNAKRNPPIAVFNKYHVM